MGKKLLIVASKRYGDYVKEIAESMGCFEEISFVDNDREGAIGKLEEVETFYPEYRYAIAACDDGEERLKWNKKLEMHFITYLCYSIKILQFLHLLNYSQVALLSPERLLVVEVQFVRQRLLVPISVVEPYCLIGDGCTLKSGTIVKSTSALEYRN